MSNYFHASTSDSDDPIFKDNCAKNNKHRAILSAVET